MYAGSASRLRTPFLAQPFCAAGATLRMGGHPQPLPSFSGSRGSSRSGSGSGSRVAGAPAAVAVLAAAAAVARTAVQHGRLLSWCTAGLESKPN